MQSGVDRQITDDALHDAIAACLPELRAAARLLTASRAEADDLVQDAVVRMLRGASGFVVAPEHAGDVHAALRPWAIAVLRNAFREGWRRRKREQAQLALRPPAEDGRSGGQESLARMRDLARAIAALPHAAGKKRTVVITQGASSTVVVDGADAPLLTVPVAPVANVIDTNGAGDAFAGGFLAWRAKGASLEDAVKAGHWAAGHIITRSGCTFDRSLKYAA